MHIFLEWHPVSSAVEGDKPTTKTLHSLPPNFGMAAAEFCIYSSLYDEMKIKKEKRIEEEGWGDGDNELFLRISRS